MRYRITKFSHLSWSTRAHLCSRALLSGTSLIIFSRRCRSIWESIVRRTSIRILNCNQRTTSPHLVHARYARGHCIITSRQKWPFLTHPPTLSRFVTFPNTHPPTPPAWRNYSSTGKRPLKTTHCCFIKHSFYRPRQAKLYDVVTILTKFKHKFCIC